MPLNNEDRVLDNKEVSSAFVNDEDKYNKPTKAIPRPEVNTGIDTSDKLLYNIIGAGDAGKIDIGAIEAFSRVSQRRDQIYTLLDTMCEDSTIAAILETYAEDATEYNDAGQIVWAESADANVSKFISFLLDTMCVDKHIYKWVHSLCKYGDLYLRLYRQSDIKNDDLFSPPKMEDKSENNTLNESLKADGEDSKKLEEEVKIKTYSKNDHYIHYLESEANPAEIFELTKYGKTYGYIKAEVRANTSKTNNLQMPEYQYRFKKGDVDVHSATDYVHACLEDNSSRVPEVVDIFLDDKSFDANEEADKLTYTVKRGQSLLYNVFKIWRELGLLENAILLNRITKSSIVRLINVEVGDMAKENVGPHLQGIKQLVEQKAAINEGTSMNEYTNPGPIENNIYVPTHGGIGAISTQQVGGDVQMGQLTDLDYFQNKFFGAMRVPKQYFGLTDDGAGFNGGQSLAIISSRYAKMVKRIQNTILQALTDAINLMLLDKGLNKYINNFVLRMQAPTTQEEIDRRENVSSKVGITRDIMDLVSDVDDASIKLRILKSLLSSVITDSEVIELIQEQIDAIESGEVSEDETNKTDEPLGLGGGAPVSAGLPSNVADAIDGIDSEAPEEVATDDTKATGEETILPTPEELGVGDLTDNNIEI